MVASKNIFIPGEHAEKPISPITLPSVVQNDLLAIMNQDIDAPPQLAITTLISRTELNTFWETLPIRNCWTPERPRLPMTITS